MVADLENGIRNLEADVIAKERIILEKNEANNILWEKIKALEVKEEKPTSQVTDMDLDNKMQKKKKRPNKKRKRARAQHNKNGMINKIEIELDLMNAINKSIKLHDIGHGLWIKKQNDFIDDKGTARIYLTNRLSEYGLKFKWCFDGVAKK
ncbi:hypothetical protein RhiirA1_462661 [Rhizophagus irregularis]|uniref:Uncharacterized protein n=1 Tax=Rhizophagus irregularis TaxID=588596 RepID=A0A2I1EX38_9GLOM|nr:hypothetical protein RhiirA1_462661 [Rhizophagus irregularis]PKY26689.1 hypothetical protein RhiirB3_442083 [Rhizophagus irregularis]